VRVVILVFAPSPPYKSNKKCPCDFSQGHKMVRRVRQPYFVELVRVRRVSFFEKR